MLPAADLFVTERTLFSAVQGLGRLPFALLGQHRGRHPRRSSVRGWLYASRADRPAILILQTYNTIAETDCATSEAYVTPFLNRAWAKNKQHDEQSAVTQ